MLAVLAQHVVLFKASARVQARLTSAGFAVEHCFALLPLGFSVTADGAVLAFASIEFINQVVLSTQSLFAVSIGRAPPFPWLVADISNKVLYQCLPKREVPRRLLALADFFEAEENVAVDDSHFQQP
uniref:Putative secreted protein n=1 Tax=Ixodes ricinus TaxID=34613 RepID=A0A6B0UR93_IXORI